jgi:putative ABC transport system permease protein
LYNVQTLDGMLENSLAARRITMRLLAAFAGIALALAMIGVYGVISHLVGQRTREIGVRVALGGQPADIARLIISQGGKMVLSGLAVGTVLALVMARLIASELFGVTAHDPVTFGLVLGLLMLSTLLACYLPARRASRIDPLVALQRD